MELLAKDFSSKHEYHNKRKELVAEGYVVLEMSTKRTLLKPKTFELHAKDFPSKREFHAKRKALVAEGYVIQNGTVDCITFLSK
jgi:hypothetical protein